MTPRSPLGVKNGSLAIVVSGLLLLAGCSKGPPARVTAQAAAVQGPASPREVVLDAAAVKQAGLAHETVRVRSLPQVLRATGRVALNENQTWRVGAVTDGRITSIQVNPGDDVKQGQTLARMHSHDIHESRAQYRKAVAELTRLQSVQTQAQRMRDRVRRLYQLKAASLEQTEMAETELSNAETAVSNGQVEVERTKRHLTEFLQIPADTPDHPPDVPHDDTADLIPIKSPATGTLLSRNVTPGTVVQASGDLFVVSDLSSLWMIAAVAEEYLPRLRTGMPVAVYVQAYPDQPARGRIGKLGEELDATTRTVRVRVDLPNRGGRLKPEMYATAEIELGGSEPALFVPQEAIQEVSGEVVVFVRHGEGHYEARPVRPGRVLEGSQEITHGLKSGEAVVTRGGFQLKSQMLKSTLAEE
ncbi:MAG TPA: efflux RND transporter periplasmic adaptor subunit [Bryobacteraceae bacterium]|nr:efflux RND transporter periplasmic adaptor subunit [Bryobacteraceae bacterium]